MSGISRLIRYLNDLYDVNVLSPSDGDAIVYDSAAGEWTSGPAASSEYKTFWITSSGTLADDVTESPRWYPASDTEEVTLVDAQAWVDTAPDGDDIDITLTWTTGGGPVVTNLSILDGNNASTLTAIAGVGTVTSSVYMNMAISVGTPVTPGANLSLKIRYQYL